MAALRNSNYYEMGLVHPKVPDARNVIYASDYRDGLHAIDKNGCVDVPEGPGLGVVYNWDYIMKHRTAFIEYK
jgi:L-alanine-DL-glutamate epimerase-like enolase superfamily enzyme